MTDDHQKIAEAIRSGAYFNQARAWYQAIYIGPVSERTFFVLIAALASFIAVMAVISLVSLLPIVKREALVIPVRGEVDSYSTTFGSLRQGQEQVASAMSRFFISQYVTQREGYSAATWEASANFVHTHSSTAVYDAYLAQRRPDNPESLAAILGQDGVMQVSLSSVEMNVDKETQDTIATVQFTTESQNAPAETKTRWTARMKYQYTDITVEAEKNTEAHGDQLKITDPEFQVTEYVVEKN